MNQFILGYMPDTQQQQVIVQTVKETAKWWIPIAVAVIAAIGSIVIAFLRRKK